MRSEINCTGCGIPIGTHVEYSEGYYGQDPPEDIFDNEDEVVFDFDDNPFCTQTCMDEHHGESEEEEEDDAQGSLFESEPECGCEGCKAKNKNNPNLTS